MEAVIGLEIHVQLKTKSKMFCSCDNAADGAAPNTLICPVCTGHPGTLPVPNRQAIAYGLMVAEALGCQIPEHAKFDRKHYTYPDLPKGYQISQYDEPIGVHGRLSVPVDGVARTFGITRVHLEEDVGKMFHRGRETFVDFNRAGTPLIEIVTEPDFRTPAEAKAFLQELRLTMRSLGVSDADMEKGQLRCDANISLRPKGSKEFFPKTEIKNVNSFRSVERALAYEIERQSKLWAADQAPAGHSTRGWDEDAGETVPQREKEAAADYRYFPEPDIPPLHLTPEFLREVSAETPELPGQKRTRFVQLYGLSTELAHQLVYDPALSKYFEEVISELREYLQGELGAQQLESTWERVKSEVAKLIATWLLNRIPAEHRQLYGLAPANDQARLLWMLYEKHITQSVASKLYEQMVRTKKGPHLLVKELGLENVSDASALSEAVRSILDAHPDQVEQYRQGKTAVLQFFVGQVMRATKGTADANLVSDLVKKSLK